MAAGYTNSVSQIQLSVRGGTVQPAGADYLVWVNTDTAIPNWQVSPDSPNVPAEGTVWIKDGVNNGINILRRNALVVFPSGCKQYIGGVWKNKDAYLYMDGSWKQFSSTRQYLFSANSWHDAVTGGWSSDGYRQSSVSKSGGAGYDGPSIYCTGKSGTYEGANGTGLAIDMRSFNTLYVDGVAASASNAFVFVATQKNLFLDNYVAMGGLNTTRSVIAVDVSNVSSGYIVFTSFSGKNETSRVYEMWLE